MIESDKPQTTTSAVDREVRPDTVYIGDYFTHMRSGMRFVVVGIHTVRDGLRVRSTVELESSPEG